MKFISDTVFIRLLKRDDICTNIPLEFRKMDLRKSWRNGESSKQCCVDRQKVEIETHTWNKGENRSKLVKTISITNYMKININT